MAKRQAGIPQQGEQARQRLRMGSRHRVFSDYLQVDVRTGVQLTATVAADREQAHLCFGVDATPPGLAH